MRGRGGFLINQGAPHRRVFRNVKISDKKIKNAEFFAPFNFFILKEKNKCRNGKIQRRRPFRAAPRGECALSRSDELWIQFNRTLYKFLKTLYA